MIDKIQGVGIGGKDLSLPGLKQVCAEFEAVFLRHMLKTMRSSMAGGGIFGKSHQAEMYGSLMDEKIASDMAGKRGIGIGDFLFRKLQGPVQSSEEIPGKPSPLRNGTLETENRDLSQDPLFRHSSIPSGA